MVRNLVIVTLFLSIFVMNGCYNITKEKYPTSKGQLTYSKKLIYKSQFRINGFYYGKSYRTGNDSSITVTYFFQDGTYFSAGLREYMPKRTEVSPDCFIPEACRSQPWCWGAYIVSGDTVKIQNYNSYRDATEKFKIEERWAKIMNDTTLFFFKYIDPNGKASSTSLLTHFKFCDTKPDSTNILMEK